MKKHVCPECSTAGIRKSYDDARGLGSHRRYVHAIVGKSFAANQRYRQRHRLKHLKGLDQNTPFLIRLVASLASRMTRKQLKAAVAEAIYNPL